MKKVIIDTDPGTDDALAIIMGLNSPEIDILGITTTGGNAKLKDTTRNALRIINYLNPSVSVPGSSNHIPVSPGSGKPIDGDYTYGYDYHGAAGIGVKIPSTTSTPSKIGAEKLMTQFISEFPNQVTVIALGPLTNIARTLLLQPQIAKLVKETVIMGGAFEIPGNITPYAEFNICNDPEAAKIVFESGMRIRIIGLDVTNQVYILQEDCNWETKHNQSARLSNMIIRNWFRFHQNLIKYPLHDPLAILATIKPELLTYTFAEINVETKKTESIGNTKAIYKNSGSVKIAKNVQSDTSKSIIIDRLCAFQSIISID